MEYQKLIIKLAKEPTFLRYGKTDLVLRSVPDEQIEFYSKIKGGKEHKLPLTLDTLKTTIRDCKEISREEYDSI